MPHNLAGIDAILALAPAEIDAVPLAFIEREAGDGQGLALCAGLLDPVVAAAASVASSFFGAFLRGLTGNFGSKHHGQPHHSSPTSLSNRTTDFGIMRTKAVIGLPRSSVQESHTYWLALKLISANPASHFQ